MTEITTSLRISAAHKRRLTEFGRGSMARGIRRMIHVMDMLVAMETETPGIELERALRIAIGGES